MEFRALPIKINSLIAKKLKTLINCLLHCLVEVFQVCPGVFTCVGDTA